MHKEKITFKAKRKKEEAQVVKYELPHRANWTKIEITKVLGWSRSDSDNNTISLVSKVSFMTPIFLFLLHTLLSYSSNNTIDYEEFFKTYYEKIERIEEGQKKCPELTSKEQIALENIENQLLRHHTPWERSEDLSKIEQLPFASKIKELKAPHEATNYITDNINQEVCSCIGKVIVQTDSIKYSLNLQKDREILRNNINNSSFIVDYPNLIYLNLSYVLVWDDNKSLAPEILTLESLQTLVLEHNEIDFLPEQINLLTKLRKLSLKDNDLMLLPHEITQLKNLESLNISQNILRAEWIPWWFEQLKKLDLSENGLKKLPNTIRKNKALEELIINNNSITTIERFEKEDKPKFIRTIDLSNNKVGRWNKAKSTLDPKDSKRVLKQFKKGIVKFS